MQPRAACLIHGVYKWKNLSLPKLYDPPICSYPLHERIGGKYAHASVRMNWQAPGSLSGLGVEQSGQWVNFRPTAGARRSSITGAQHE